MEEIWKDIPNLSSLQNPNNSTFHAMNLQEILARPFLNPNYNVFSPIFPATTAAATHLFPSGHASPVTNNNNVLLRPHGNSLSSPVSNMTLTQQQLCLGMQSSSRGSARKRIAIPYENDDQNNSSSRSDCRYMRLIKNRESAARSRDRKEELTARLEEDVKTLRAENARLRKEQHLRVAAAAQASKKHTLNRTSSSPF